MISLSWVVASWAVTLFVLRRLRLIPPLEREHVALMLLLAGVYSIVNRTTQEIAANPFNLEGAVRLALAATSLGISLALIGARRRSVAGAFRRSLLGFSVYVLVAVSSVLYSVSTTTTIGKGLELTAALALFVAIATRSDRVAVIRDSITLVLFLEASLLIVAVAGFFAVPSVFSLWTGRPGFFMAKTLGSPYISADGLSALGALLSAFSTARLLGGSPEPKEKVLLRTLIVFGIAAIVLASGRQGVVILMASIGILLILYRKRLFFLLLGPAVVGLLVIYWDQFVQVFTRGGRVEQTLALTGRVGFWQSALEALASHPWTGFGFGAGGRFVAQAQIGNSSLPGVHSGYVEALIGVGILGSAPLLYVVLRVGVWSFQRIRRKITPEFAILILPLTLHTIISLGFGGWVTPDLLILGLLAAWESTDDRVRTRTGHRGQALVRA
jgi:O-antigen ligase